jgi:hypothetical protein
LFGGEDQIRNKGKIPMRSRGFQIAPRRDNFVTGQTQAPVNPTDDGGTRAQ